MTANSARRTLSPNPQSGNGILAFRHQGPGRGPWLSASLLFIVMSAATYAYFVPTMLSFMHSSEEYTPAALTRSLAIWTSLSWLRTIIGGAAWLCAMRALVALTQPKPLAQPLAS